MACGPLVRARCSPHTVALRRTISTAAAANCDAGVSPGDADVKTWVVPRSQAREPSPLRILAPKGRLPGMIGLHTGMPNPKTFPFERFSMTLKDGTKVEFTDDEMAFALQYGDTPGANPLRERLKNLLLTEHQPPAKAAQLELSMSTGSQDALSRTFEMLLGPDDNLIMDSPSYPGALAFIKPLGCGITGVGVDECGLRADLLEKTLEDWDEATQGKRPRVLYTIPTASNPTGATQTAERKAAIYKVAQRFNLLIMEDDPYYFLQFSPKRHKSYLSMDTDARVLRFDSFSKIMAAGMRLGFVSGPKNLVNQIDLHMQSTCLHPSGLSQATVLAFFRHLGIGESVNADGDLGAWEDLVQSVVAFYKKQCDAAVELATRHLEGVAEVRAPEAGMFLWMKLIGIPDSRDVIEEDAVALNVLAVPGYYFMPNGEVSDHIRTSFSHATPEAMDEGFKRLGQALRAHRDKLAAEE